MRKRDEGSKQRLRRHLLGWAQNLVIVLLLVSTVALVAESGMLDLSAVKGAGSEQNSVDRHAAYTAAAKPMCVVLTPESGMHSAIMYEADALELAYERYSSTLAEALGSSGEPEQITQEQWEAALSGPGVYFDYYGDYQLSILAIWLGTEMSGEASGHTARRFCLAIEGEDVYLCYIRERGEGGYYRCATAVSAADLLGRVSESMPNGAEYNFEQDEPFGSIDPYMVLLGEDEFDGSALESALTGLTVSEFTDEAPSGKKEIGLTISLDNETFPQVEVRLSQVHREVYACL